MTVLGADGRALSARGEKTRQRWGKWPVRLLALAGSFLVALASFGWWLDSRVISDEERGQFLLDYMNLLLTENVPDSGKALSRERWVINKIRALGSWYTKGLDGGSHLRTAINSAGSLPQLRELIGTFFLASASVA